MERRTGRTKKVSTKMGMVDEAARQEAVAARLAALENDHQDTGGAWGEEEDDEFELLLDSDGEEVEAKGKKRKKGPLVKGPHRKTRAMIAEKSKGPRTFQTILDEAAFDQQPDAPSYLTAAVGPSTTRSARKICSVCSGLAPYQCTRCGARFCTKKCMGVHQETRCLKMVN